MAGNIKGHVAIGGLAYLKKYTRKQQSSNLATTMVSQNTLQDTSNLQQQDALAANAPIKKAAASCVGGRRINKKKVKSANRLATRKALKQAKMEAGKQQLIQFQVFQKEMEAGKFDEKLLECIRKGNPEAEEEALQEALVLQKQEFLSGSVTPKEALKVKGFLEAQMSPNPNNAEEQSTDNANYTNAMD